MKQTIDSDTVEWAIDICSNEMFCGTRDSRDEWVIALGGMISKGRGTHKAIILKGLFRSTMDEGVYRCVKMSLEEKTVEEYELTDFELKRFLAMEKQPVHLSLEEYEEFFGSIYSELTAEQKHWICGSAPN
jgi:hypothetical protein